jgi:hypothetical protein
MFLVGPEKLCDTHLNNKRIGHNFRLDASGPSVVGHKDDRSMDKYP